METKEATNVFNGNTPIFPTPGADSIAMKPIHFFNDLDILLNGDIIFSDSSYKFTRSENRQELLDAAPRGRLVLYSQETKSFHVKLCGLHFPNGVQLIVKSKQVRSGDEVIVSDSARFRLIKVNLSHPFIQGEISLSSTSPAPVTPFSSVSSCSEYGSFYQALKMSGDRSYDSTGVKVLTDSLPGFADNIRYDVWSSRYPERKPKNADSTYYFISMGTHSFQPFSLLHFIYQRNYIRDFIGKFIPMKLIEHFVVKYGLVVVINQDGEIVSSLHDATGKGCAFISQMERHPVTGDLWIESHSERRLVILPHDQIPTLL